MLAKHVLSQLSYTPTLTLRFSTVVIDQSREMTTCSKSGCSRVEAHAGMHCRPLYFQGLTVLRSNTQPLIVRPHSVHPRFPIGNKKANPLSASAGTVLC